TIQQEDGEHERQRQADTGRVAAPRPPPLAGPDHRQVEQADHGEQDPDRRGPAGGPTLQHPQRPPRPPAQRTGPTIHRTPPPTPSRNGAAPRPPLSPPAMKGGERGRAPH